LWQVERAMRPAGPLLEETRDSGLGVRDSEFSLADSQSKISRRVSGFANPETRIPDPETSPLPPMTRDERLVADFRGTGLTVGPHPMAYWRAEMNKLGVRSAIELQHLPNAKRVQIGGCVIARQRPGTAKGFVFLSLEDETGIANAIITPDIFEQNRVTIVQEQFLLVEGKLQNQDNVISVKAEHVRPLVITQAETSSHDFH
jgi:error-prone DNA polymerase